MPQAANAVRLASIPTLDGYLVLHVAVTSRAWLVGTGYCALATECAHLVAAHVIWAGLKAIAPLELAALAMAL